MYLTEDMDYQESVIFIAVLLIFTNHRMTDACRGYGKRPPATGRHPHKSDVPLRLGQRIPNISEKTVGASGPSEGKITRGDKRFDDLVTNINPSIVFKTGANKQMSRRCDDRLNLLALKVQQNWPGVRLRVLHAWDGDNQHGDNSLHYEGRAVALSTSDRDRTKYGMLARYAVDAGFDWVYYKSTHYIYASVIADDVQSRFEGGCFPKDSDVTMGDGTVRKIADLKVGDKVVTLDRFTGERKVTEVILMMHKNIDTVFKFLKITAETNIANESSQRQITLTANHLVYKHNSNSSVRWQPRAVFAEDVILGDYIYFDSLEITNGTDFALAKVTAVDVVKRQGVFAPLTTEGSITVDGVAASSYAVYNNEEISHALFYPLRLLWRWGLKWGDSLSINKHAGGVHWYPRSIFHFANAILPKGVLNP